MKKPYKLLLNSLLIFLLVLLTNMVHAQTAGPSDATTPAPTIASAVGKVYCTGSTITLNTTPTPTNTTYQWYKYDASLARYVLASGQTTSTYTEASGAAGYYNYKVVAVNATTGCTSPASPVLQVYVLPPLNVTISTTAAAVCAGLPAPTLTANITAPTAAVITAAGYTINYQWTLAGNPIAGETNPTYNVPVNNTPGILNYGVTVEYALNTSCSATASQSITINALPAQPTITAN